MHICDGSLVGLTYIVRHSVKSVPGRRRSDEAKVNRFKHHIMWTFFNNAFNFRLNSQVPARNSKTVSYQETSLEELFANLDISEYASLFNGEGITLADLLISVAEEDLKEINLPLVRPHRN